jgi:hypothetical protein
LAVLATDPSANDLAGLATMHERLIKDAPAWYDRVEVDYLSPRRSRTFERARGPRLALASVNRFIQSRSTTAGSRIGITSSSPGSPCMARHHNSSFRPFPTANSSKRFGSKLLEWPDRLTEDLGPRGRTYAVLTACRAMRVCRTGDYVSKKEAAGWRGECPLQAWYWRGRVQSHPQQA